jgi:type II secretory pathway component PulF
MQIPALDTFLHRVTGKDRTFLARQLALMIHSGIPLAQALRLASQQTTNVTVREGLLVMVNDLEHGQPFSAAASRFPNLFDTVSVAMIKSGEASGKLSEVMLQIADQQDRSLQFVSKVRSALIYPAFVVGVMILVGIIMTTVIVPRLNELFVDSQIVLPLSTRILVGVSNGILHFWYVVILLVAAASVLIRTYLTSPAGRQAIISFQLAVPALRSLVITSYLVRFTDIMGMLFRAGVSLPEAMTITSESLNHPEWARVLAQAREEVERGVPLSAALSRHSLFPPALTQMIAVGEQTGTVDSVLDTMCTYYREQTDTALKNFTSLLEPIILLVVALGVAFVVISVILPIYNLSDQL